METIDKPRRRKLVCGESISAIARNLNLSRNTVRKYLKADTGPICQRQSQPNGRVSGVVFDLDGVGQRRTARCLFEGLHSVKGTVGGAYDRNRYSVPAEYAGRQVSLRVYAGQIKVVADGKVAADHACTARMSWKQHAPWLQRAVPFQYRSS